MFLSKRSSHDVLDPLHVQSFKSFNAAHPVAMSQNAPTPLADLHTYAPPLGSRRHPLQVIVMPAGACRGLVHGIWHSSPALVVQRGGGGGVQHPLAPLANCKDKQRSI